jgi:hypothetical protein
MVKIVTRYSIGMFSITSGRLCQREHPPDPRASRNYPKVIRRGRVGSADEQNPGGASILAFLSNAGRAHATGCLRYAMRWQSLPEVIANSS